MCEAHPPLLSLSSDNGKPSQAEKGNFSTQNEAEKSVLQKGKEEVEVSYSRSRPSTFALDSSSLFVSGHQIEVKLVFRESNL